MAEKRATATSATPARSNTNGATSGRTTPIPKMKRNDSDFSKLIIGPRDLDHHSKWPIFLQLHGSITPEMLLPLTFVAGWSTAITCISKYVHDLGINQLLLTVLGFVVGLALSFRSSTAYERYNEGRKYWAQLAFCSQNLARLIWVHAAERHNNVDDPSLGKEDLLGKINCLNMIVGFAVALKHRLRFEPYAHYDDLRPLIGHLDTFAAAAGPPPEPPKIHPLKKAGLFLGLPMAESNPRKALKKSRAPLGNLPLEILTHLSSYLSTIYANETLKLPIYQTQSFSALATMNDILSGTDRILNTPLPIAYSIAIAQITWVYILLLPFQLYKSLGWVTIPASVFAAYIILGIALIGREIENPFGDDVNDLPLDTFCQQIKDDVNVIMAKPAPHLSKRAATMDNSVTTLNEGENPLMYPMSELSAAGWASKSVDEIRGALLTRVRAGKARDDQDVSGTGEA